jgi:hypothetical protein
MSTKRSLTGAVLQVLESVGIGLGIPELADFTFTLVAPLSDLLGNERIS